MAIDTSATIEIEASPLSQLGLLAGGVVLTGLSVALVAGAFDGGRRSVGLVEHAFGYLGIVFFGACTAILGWRIATAHGAVLTLSPAGLRDTRLADSTIPWGAIQAIGTWRHKRQSMMVLAIGPEFEKSLVLTRVAAMTRSANRALIGDGLFVSTTELKIKHADLVALTTAYLTQHQTARVV